MTAPELVAKMRRGDASAWPRWAPELLPFDEILEAWAEVLPGRGRPGNPRTLHVYVHHPFCPSSCRFCMYWHRVPRRDEEHARYADHLVALLERYRERLGPIRATNAYFGGGTPSAQPRATLERTLDAFFRTFDVACEVTFEAHPATLDHDKLRVLADHGVNRLSMGLQSLDPEVLATIKRQNPGPERLAASVACAQRAGMHVNLDLCFGLPGQSLESFRRDVEGVTSLSPDLVTLYLYQPVARLPAPAPAPRDLRAAFDPALLARTLRAGFLPVLPFGEDRPGGRLVRPSRGLIRRGAQRARAAMSRRIGRDVGSPKYGCFGGDPSHLLGLGPAAYSHLFGRAWFREVTATRAGPPGQPAYWGTRLSAADEARQLVLASLGSEGSIDLERVRRASGVDPLRVFEPALRPALSSGRLSLRGSRLRLARGASSEPLLDALLPEARPEAEAPEVAIEPDLLQNALLRREHDPSPDADDGSGEEARARLRAFAEAAGLPGPGGELRGARVLSHDRDAVTFRLGGEAAPALRVTVGPPDQDRCYARSERFTLSYAPRPAAPLTDSERAFLDALAGSVGARRGAPVER